MNARIRWVIDFLERHKSVENIRVVNYDESPTGLLEVKIRCRLCGSYQFQVWLIFSRSHQYYAYQLFTDRPLLR